MTVPKKKGGRSPRQIGDRCEREIVKLHIDMGVHAERVVCSGSHLDKPYDIDVYIDGKDNPPIIGEVKRKDLPKVIVNALGENDLLFVRPKATPGQAKPTPYAVMPWATYARLVGK